MEEQSMVDIVAKAILAEAQNMGALAFTLPIEKRLAIAAIKAMRDPTEIMVDATGNGECNKWARGAWALMIDAALNEQEKG